MFENCHTNYKARFVLYRENEHILQVAFMEIRISVWYITATNTTVIP